MVKKKSTGYEKKPKVLILIATDIIGGPGKGLFQFLKHADHSRFDYILCNYVRSGMSHIRTDFYQQAANQNIEVKELVQRTVLDPSLVTQAAHIIRNEKVDLVQTHGYKSNLLGCLLKLFYRMPWIAFAHGYTSENIKILAYNRLDSLGYRFADRVVVVSNPLKSFVLSRGVKKSKVVKIHNAIDSVELIADVSPNDFRRHLGIARKEIIIGVIGRLSPEKGHLIFLKALKKLLKDMPFVKALFLGDGQEEQALKAYCRNNGIRKRVIFAGHCKNVANYYQVMHLVAIPSLSEGLPNVLLEAMAFGVPVIATDVGAIREVLSDRSGVIIPPGKPDVIRKAIFELLNNDNRMQRNSAVAKQEVRTRFDPVARADRIVNLYYTLLNF